MKDVGLKINGMPGLYESVSTIVTRNDKYRDWWMPKEETILTDLKVKSNGTYDAGQMGFYGFSKVSVNIPNERPNEIVGTDPETGDVYAISVDEEGVITKTLIGRAE